MNSSDELRSFIRHTLGCSCPGEVFEHMIRQYDVELENGISINAKINVGNRLLIYVVEVDDPGLVERDLHAMISAGKNERDREGFNRFRLVLATERKREISDIGNRAFEALPDRDEKVHLHIIEKTETVVLYE